MKYMVKIFVWILCGLMLSCRLAFAVSLPLGNEASKPDTQERVELLLQLLQDDQVRAALTKQLQHPKTKLADEENVLITQADSLVDGVQQQLAFMRQHIRSLLSHVMSLSVATVHWSYQQLSEDKHFSHMRQLLYLTCIFVVMLAVRGLLQHLSSRPTHMLISMKRKNLSMWLGVAASRCFMELLNVVLACVVGYVIWELLPGEAWSNVVMSYLLISVACYLFALVFARALLAPEYTELRCVAMPDDSARYLYYLWRRLAAFIAFAVIGIGGIAYHFDTEGLLTQVYLDVVGLVMSLWLLVLVWRHRYQVSQAMAPPEAQYSSVLLRVLQPTQRVVARCWHWIATAYIAVMAWGWIFDFNTTFNLQIWATVYSIILLVTLLLTKALWRWFVTHLRHMLLNYRTQLPFFCVRAKRLLQFLSQLVDVAVVLLAAVALAVIWRFTSYQSVLESSFWQQVLRPLSHWIFIVVVAASVWLSLITLIEYHMAKGRSDDPRHTHENHTVLQLLRNVLTVLVVVVTTMMVLAESGVHIGPLIAGAGIVSLAVGFGAQTLVKDVINGLFNIIEGTLRVGYWVCINGQDGWVERVSLRTVSLRNSLTGTVAVIPFSEVTMVENYSKEYAYYFGQLQVGYEQDYDEVVAVIEAVGQAMQQDEAICHEMMSSVEVRGLQNFEASGYTISCRIKAKPGRQRVIGRYFNQQIKKAFDHHGISFPYPTRTVIMSAPE